LIYTRKAGFYHHENWSSQIIGPAQVFIDTNWVPLPPLLHQTDDNDKALKRSSE